jgi:molecular chaperone GrpE (heat shock protein)
MNLFVSKANKEIEALKAEKEKFIEAAVAMEAEVKSAQKAVEDMAEAKVKGIEEMAAANADLTKQLEAAKAEIVNLKTVKQSEVEAAKSTANKQAAQIVASLGVAEGTVKDATEEVTPAQIAAHYKTLTGAARAQYFAEHEATILKGLGVKK